VGPCRNDAALLLVEENPIMGVPHHLVVGIQLHEGHDPTSDLLASVHLPEDMFNVRAVLGEEIRKGVVVGGRGARVRDSFEVLVRFAHLIQRELGRVVSFRWLEFSLSTVEVDRTEVGSYLAARPLLSTQAHDQDEDRS